MIPKIKHSNVKIKYKTTFSTSLQCVELDNDIETVIIIPDNRLNNARHERSEMTLMSYVSNKQPQKVSAFSVNINKP